MHRRSRWTAPAAAALAVGLGAAASSSAPAVGAEVRYVSGPGSQFTNYTVPVLVIRKGDTVTYTNADIAPHDVVSDVKGPDRPWCAQAGFGPGQCPLVWSPLIGIGVSTPVYGLESLTAGQQVAFHCTLHPGMNATLIVSPV